MIIAQTDRLLLRKIELNDAPFILRLLNEPSFLKNIGDRGVRTIADAEKYITDGPMTSYEKHGFGLYMVELKSNATPIGICGLLKRDYLEEVDVGFAFIPEFWCMGYASESAQASIDHGRRQFGLKSIAAITNEDNIGSIKVLEKLGLGFHRMITPPGEEKEIKLYIKNFLP